MRVQVCALSLLALFGCSGDDKVQVDDSGGGSGGSSGGSGGSSGGADDSADDSGGGSGGSGGSSGGDSSGGGTDWPALVINEFMASNSSTYADESGAYPDWIELYNPTSEAVDLAGYTITDDSETIDKHVLGALSLPAGGFLVLFADGDTDEGDNHLGFSLDSGGGYLGLYAPDGTALDLLNYQEQATDYSAARVPDGTENWEITSSATPGESNGG